MIRVLKLQRPPDGPAATETLDELGRPRPPKISSFELDGVAVVPLFGLALIPWACDVESSVVTPPYS